MNKNHSSIASLVREIRLKLGLTQEGLARLMGVSFTSVNRWENAQTRPSPLAQKQLKKLLTKIEGSKPKENYEHG